MEDDACPRLAPPPKPTLQEMGQAKPVVPEVSLLLSGYDNTPVPPRQTNNIDGGVQEMNVNTGGITYPQTSIPSSQSNQTTTTTTTTPSTQNIRPNFPDKRVLPNPESPCVEAENTNTSSDHFMYQLIEDNNHQIKTLSPCVEAENTNTSSDHFMYQLIEDNNHQIKTLSKTIEMLMERQREGDVATTTPEREQTHKVLYARSTLGGNNNNNNNNKGVQKDVSAQTVPSELLETRSIGVNTDISWSELVASIRNDDNNSTAQHKGIRTRCINNDMRLNNNRQTTQAYDTRHNNNNNRQTLNRQTTQDHQEPNQTPDDDDNNNDEEEEGQILVHSNQTNILTSQEQQEEEDFQVLYQPPLPPSTPSLLPSHVVSCGGAAAGGVNRSPSHTLRNVGNEGVSQEAAGHCVMLRENVATSHPDNQNNNNNNSCTGVPSPGTNFYDNILANIQHILQNSDAAHDLTQQQQQPQQQQLDHPLQSAPQRERRPMGESHVEALREQLIQFGISFMEPGTHTDHPQGIMDTMYLPRVHNMLSMYQSAISTHYHPGQPRLDATTAKYLTDSQLAAIAAKSSVTVSQDARRRSQGSSPNSPSTNTNTTTQEASSQLYRFTVSNNVSMSSINFLEKYGLKEDQ
ncbi:hypothetical protein Pcinc_038290 [Petrolisthes cinctipes]|uniref:Uncharacterized protein n=1 Tax=Petrolisthes cinctipes TaxID=88211 RepID=A0AAE1EN60_PETCI|nr:hypothetical protein Pcinc_038290 [Petrolisthes cinctipes]